MSCAPASIGSTYPEKTKAAMPRRTPKRRPARGGHRVESLFQPGRNIMKLDKCVFGGNVARASNTSEACHGYGNLDQERPGCTGRGLRGGPSPRVVYRAGGGPARTRQRSPRGQGG